LKIYQQKLNTVIGILRLCLYNVGSSLTWHISK